MPDDLLHSCADDQTVLSCIQIHRSVVAIQGLGNIGKNLILGGRRLQLPFLCLLLFMSFGDVPAKDVGYRNTVLIGSHKEVDLMPVIGFAHRYTAGNRAHKTCGIASFPQSRYAN